MLTKSWTIVQVLKNISFISLANRTYVINRISIKERYIVWQSPYAWGLICVHSSDNILVITETTCFERCTVGSVLISRRAQISVLKSKHENKFNDKWMSWFYQQFTALGLHSPITRTGNFSSDLFVTQRAVSHSQSLTTAITDHDHIVDYTIMIINYTGLL